MSERTRYLKGVRRVVVKVGSQVIAGGGSLNEQALERLVTQLSGLVERGLDVALVSSGAVAAGRGKLGLRERPKTIPLKQAAAAAGQAVLMHHYERLFSKLGIRVAQVLLTSDDLANRRRFLNARNTLLTLFELGVVPVINENDTVVVEEIKFGDNDRLSSLVTNVIESQLLVILTDAGGFFDADPRVNPEARRYEFIENLGEEHFAQAGASGSEMGSGGMITKLQAAQTAALTGTHTVIAPGDDPDTLRRILDGEPVGTFIVGGRPIGARKHWIATTVAPQGELVLDEGAVRALVERGKSLLPSGVVEVRGEFGLGDAVCLLDSGGREVGRGLVEYPADDLRRIAGRQSSEIEEILGYKYYDHVMRRDDLVVTARRPVTGVEAARAVQTARDSGRDSKE